MAGTLIVGAGSAGCVLAARLSADPARTVRVLEAGPVWPALSAMPAALRDPAHLPVGPDSEVVWRYPGNLVRGRLAGGSGAINGSYFLRPPAADFVAWSAAAGRRWSFDAVLPVFRGLENDLDFGAGPDHGDSGPVPVSRTADPAPVSVAFAARCAAAGFTELTDLNAGSGAAEGFGRVPLTISGGRRAGPAVTHLYPAAARPNLTVTGETTVTRLLWRGTRVVGVEWTRGAERGTSRADQVVLCAGAVESAALLLRSGIGPEAQLRALGIPVVRPAPVGAWCTDHPEIGIEYPGEPGRPAVALEYVLELADLELRPYTPQFTAGLRRLGVALMHPVAAGELTLRAPEASVPPHIDQGYLRRSPDRAALRDGVDIAAQILGRRLGPVDEAWLRAHLSTSQHLSGTCRMGAATDERAVVDEYGRVHGIDGLVVADLSIVPVPLRRGPQAAVMILAAAIADYMVV
ncbi:mycofactocin system GMC family oxidoreductase MftG [Nocardia halotolerans]|uniref:Mycofactocin system GMC family oxidoreductase MftG n=1 Tax=Nocardia halotolerans TaxID=1755878 RepID=A0ABV8VI36_9NOCA